MRPEVEAVLVAARDGGIAFDYEATSLDVFTNKIHGAGIASRDGHTAFALGARFGSTEVAEVIECIQDERLTAHMYNAQFDLAVSAAHGLPVFSSFNCVYTATKLYDETWMGHEPYALDSVAGRLIDPELAKFKDSFHNYLKEKYGKDAGWASITEEDLPLLSDYAMTDALSTIMIWDLIQPSLDRQGLLDLLALEHEVIEALVAMRIDGVKVKREYLVEARAKVQQTVVELEQRIRVHTKDLTHTVKHSNGLRGKREVWETVEPWVPDLLSNPQMGKVFETFGLKSPLLTPAGKPSWSAKALGGVDHPLADLLLDYRGYMKLLTTYIDPWLEKSSRDGRLHCEFDHAGTVTGRMNSRNPNLQQIPKDGKAAELDDEVWVDTTDREMYALEKRRKAEEAQKLASMADEDVVNMRKALIADNSNQRIIRMDYEQMEVAMFAYLANDAGLIAAYESGRDVHFETAKQIFHLPEDLFWEDAKGDPLMASYRRSSKSVVFGLLFGIGIKKLGLQLDVSEKEATKLKEEFFAAFPDSARFMRKTQRQVENHGYVKTVFGRRRRLQHNEAYKGVNARVQGSCADVVKGALVVMRQDLWPDALVKLIVHDEFAVQCDASRVDEIAGRMEAIATGVFEMRPRLRVDWSVGYSYGDK